MSARVAPLFGGQSIFGDAASYQQIDLQRGTPAEIDAFLGLPENTTIYGAEATGGRIFGITGQWKENTAQEVLDAAAFLQSFTDIVSTYHITTPDPYPCNARAYANCYWSVGDLSINPAGVQQIGLNQYGLTYALVIRYTGTN